MILKLGSEGKPNNHDVIGVNHPDLGRTRPVVATLIACRCPTVPLSLLNVPLLKY